MDSKLAKKLINYALDYIERESQFIEDEIKDDIGLSKEELKSAIDTLKRDFVIVPEGDPGLRMVETEIKL